MRVTEHDAVEGFSIPHRYEIHRDKYQRSWEFSSWTIRDDELAPLYHLLGEILMARRSQAPAVVSEPETTVVPLRENALNTLVSYSSAELMAERVAHVLYREWWGSDDWYDKYAPELRVVCSDTVPQTEGTSLPEFVELVAKALREDD